MKPIDKLKKALIDYENETKTYLDKIVVQGRIYIGTKDADTITSNVNLKIKLKS